MISAANRYYHRQCFRCCRCAADLGQQEGFNQENNQLFCQVCLQLTETFVVLFASFFVFAEAAHSSCLLFSGLFHQQLWYHLLCLPPEDFSQ